MCTNDNVHNPQLKSGRESIADCFAPNISVAKLQYLCSESAVPIPPKGTKTLLMHIAIVAAAAAIVLCNVVTDAVLILHNGPSKPSKFATRIERSSEYTELV